MSVPENIDSHHGRLATFKKLHRFAKGHASSTKNTGPSSAKWPERDKAPSKHEMARAGFWYKPKPGNLDNVKCFMCEKEFDGWEKDDNPAIEHFKLYPDCSWAINVTIRILDKLGDGLDQDPMGDTLFAARKKTFLGKWPHEGKRAFRPKTQKMVEAGWCYDPSAARGEDDDGTTCFYCKASLCGWESEDDPVAEHKKRTPNCLFFQLVDKYAATRPSKTGKKGRGSAASKASRLSVQSNTSMASEAPSQMILDDDDDATQNDDSIMTTATNATTTSKKGKGKKKAPARGRVSTQSTRSTRGKGKKAAVMEETPESDPDAMDFDLGPVDDEATPEPPRKRTRKASKRDESLLDMTSSIGAAGPKRTTRKASATVKSKPVELLSDQRQLHAELDASMERSLHSVDEGTPKPTTRGTKRTSDGVPKLASGLTIPEHSSQDEPVEEKSKKARKGKKAATEPSSQATAPRSSMSTASASAPKATGRTRAGSRLATQKGVPMVSSPPRLQPSPAPLLATDAATLQHESSASPLPPTPTPARVAPAFAHRSSPVRLRLLTSSNQLRRRAPTPGSATPNLSDAENVPPPPRPAPSPNSFDAENVPPTPRPASSNSSDAENAPPPSRSATAVRRPLASLSPNRTVRIPLAEITPSARPSKRNFIGRLQSAVPWTEADLENIFMPSPSGRQVGRASGFGFGGASELTQLERENLAALDEFAAATENQVNKGLRLLETIQRVKSALTSQEAEMTVEQWVNYNAMRGEERLRGECERMVGIFEEEGARALRTLSGLHCTD